MGDYMHPPTHPPAHLQPRSLHSEPISDAALIPTTAAGTCWLLASCGLDRVQLWSLSGGGSLSSLSVLDMHARLGSSSTRLLCLAASSDGQLLAAGAWAVPWVCLRELVASPREAPQLCHHQSLTHLPTPPSVPAAGAGDSAGGVHLLSLASPTVPILLASQRVHATEITALGFAPSSGEPVTADGGSLACGAQPLVAVGSRRGGVKVLQWQPDGGALLASLLDHSSAVTGVVLAAGGTALSTAGADGKRMNYRWNAAAGQLQLAAQVAVPRSIFVGLASTLVGVAAANRTGRVYWEAAGKEANVQALQKNQGEEGGSEERREGGRGGRYLLPSLAGWLAHLKLNPLPLTPPPCRRTDRLCCGPLAVPAGVRNQPQLSAGAEPVVRQGHPCGLMQGSTRGGRHYQQGGWPLRRCCRDRSQASIWRGASMQTGTHVSSDCLLCLHFLTAGNHNARQSMGSNGG